VIQVGARGPVGKPEAERIRRNAGYKPSTYVQNEGRIQPPFDADETWHPQAIAIYESLANSAQASLFEESDWAKAYLMCESMSRELKPQFIGFSETVNPDTGAIEKKPLQARIPIKGATLNAWNSWMTTLLMTEGDRRRVNVEVKRTNEVEVMSPSSSAVASLVAKMNEKKRREA